jgi:hypothetical protein
LDSFTTGNTSDDLELHGMSRVGIFFAIDTEVGAEREKGKTEIGTGITEPALYGIGDVDRNKMVIVCVGDHYLSDSISDAWRVVSGDSLFRPVTQHHMNRKFALGVYIVDPHAKRSLANRGPFRKRREVKFHKALRFAHILAVALAMILTMITVVAMMTTIHFHTHMDIGLFALTAVGLGQVDVRIIGSVQGIGIN